MCPQRSPNNIGMASRKPAVDMWTGKGIIPTHKTGLPVRAGAEAEHPEPPRVPEDKVNMGVDLLFFPAFPAPRHILLVRYSFEQVLLAVSGVMLVVQWCLFLRFVSSRL